MNYPERISFIFVVYGKYIKIILIISASCKYKATEGKLYYSVTCTTFELFEVYYAYYVFTKEK